MAHVFALSMKFCDIPRNHFEGFGVNLSNVFDQVINLFNLGLIDDKLVPFLQIVIDVACEVWMVQ